MNEFASVLLLAMFAVTLWAFIHLVVKTKGNILGLDEPAGPSIKSRCRHRCTVDLGVYEHEEIHEIAKWLKENTKHAHWAKKLPRKAGEWQKLAVYFENKQEAMRFKLEWS